MIYHEIGLLVEEGKQLKTNKRSYTSRCSIILKEIGHYTLSWAPAGTDDRGNHEADLMAKEAAKLPLPHLSVALDLTMDQTLSLRIVKL